MYTGWSKNSENTSTIDNLTIWNFTDLYCWWSTASSSGTRDWRLQQTLWTSCL